MANQHTSGTASLTTVQRFWSKIEFTDACWLWTAGLFANGYGAFRSGTKHVKVHRYAYEFCVGPIPEGLDLDHLCHNEDQSCAGGPTCLHRSCVHPGHLEPATRSENCRRGNTGLNHSSKTECPQGHPYDEQNTAIYNGHRYCKTCQRERRRSR